MRVLREVSESVLENTMDLFDYMKEKNTEKESPLASRLRPRTLDEVVRQEHIIV